MIDSVANSNQHGFISEVTMSSAPGKKLKIRNFAIIMASAIFVVQGLIGHAISASAQELAGIYVGSMHLVDGKERDIPLSLSLVITDETISTPAGLEYVIDGAMVVDDEGGPYTFTRVSYDIENNRLDMKYQRPRNDPSTTAPASLRLVGGLDGEGGISGQVNSGVYGPIGTFKVKRNQSLTSLPYQRKYVGTWSGNQRNIRFNSSGEAEISLQPSARNTQNPPGYEFDFTPGHIGGYSSNGIWMTSFNQVVIDYLRRKITMVDDGNLINIELTIDFEKNSLTGQQTSSAYGLTTLFDFLWKIR